MRCSTCGEEKSLDEMSNDSTKPSGKDSRCRPCTSRRALANKRKRLWGVTQDQYEAMLQRDGACAVCGGVSGARRLPAVDHNHESGQVRSLLCGKCNTALGSLDEDVERILALAEYVRFWQEVANA